MSTLKVQAGGIYLRKDGTKTNTLLYDVRRRQRTTIIDPITQEHYNSMGEVFSADQICTSYKIGKNPIVSKAPECEESLLWWNVVEAGLGYMASHRPCHILDIQLTSKPITVFNWINLPACEGLRNHLMSGMCSEYAKRYSEDYSIIMNIASMPKKQQISYIRSQCEKVYRNYCNWFSIHGYNGRLCGDGTINNHPPEAPYNYSSVLSVDYNPEIEIIKKQAKEDIQKLQKNKVDTSLYNLYRS